MVLLFTIGADIADDCVTAKRNAITKLHSSPYSYIYIKLSKTTFISKAIRLKKSFFESLPCNCKVIKLRCFTKESCLEGIRRNQAAKNGIKGIIKCKSYKDGSFNM